MSKHKSLGILVTGVNGFVGGHLVAELVASNHRIYGASREDQARDEIAEHLSDYWHVDLVNASDCQKIDWSDIDAVVHLAGLANVGASFDNPELYQKVNIGVVENLFESAQSADANPRVIAVSTGAVYGRTDGPVTEDSPTEPGSPYAESKLAAEKVVQDYRSRGFANSVNVRPFNHAGPGQAPGFLIPDLGYQIANGDDPIQAGNLSSSRDYTDVRDVVRAYRLLAEADTLPHDTHNICSGSSVKGEVIFDLLRKAAGKPELEVVVAQQKLRANDEDIIVGSHERLSADTNWQPEIPIEKTIQDFMDSIL